MLQHRTLLDSRIASDESINFTDGLIRAQTDQSGQIEFAGSSFSSSHLRRRRRLRSL